MRTAICTALIALLTSSVTVLAQPGSLDLNFDGDGIVYTSTSDYGGGRSVAVQTDGRIVVVALLPDLNSGTSAIQILRYMPDGSMDNSFGTFGRVTVTSNSSGLEPIGLALQNDGKIVVAHDIGGHMAVLRFTSIGDPDNSFGGTGVVSTSFSTGVISSANCVAVQSDGKIIAAGFAADAGGIPHLALVRYTADGFLDTSFSYDGKVTTVINAVEGDVVYSLAITPDGSILAGGIEGNAFDSQDIVVKYMPDGTLDNTFGTNSISQTGFSGNTSTFGTMVLQPDGRIVFCGTVVDFNENGFGVARLTANGLLDPTFGNGGTQTTLLPQGGNACASMAMQADGKLVLTGQSGGDVALVRYTTDGSLDPSFGNGGSVVTALPTTDYGFGMTIQSDGKIVAVGAAFGGVGGPEILVLRYISGVNVGIAEAGPLSGMVLYPDPAQDHVTLSFMEPLSPQAVVTLVNPVGQTVPLSPLEMQRSADGRACDIALHGMAAGPYLLRIKEGSAVRSLPFIKE